MNFIVSNSQLKAFDIVPKVIDDNISEGDYLITNHYLDDGDSFTTIHKVIKTTKKNVSIEAIDGVDIIQIRLKWEILDYTVDSIKKCDKSLKNDSKRKWFMCYISDPPAELITELIPWRR
jgi:hypothetical protein